MVIYMYVIVIIFVFSSVCRAVYDCNSNNSLGVAVALSTIPPRFRTIHHTVRSWIDQSLPCIQHIFIFVPPYYRRFRKRKLSIKDKLSDLSTNLYDHIFEHQDLRKYLLDKTIQIISTHKDYGPITRIAGVVEFISKHPTAMNHKQDGRSIDYWLFCDDDVGYDTTVIEIYTEKLNLVTQTVSVQLAMENIGLTLFAETYRISISSSNSNVEMLPHIQGVDTYMVNHHFLSSIINSKHRIWSAHNFFKVVDFIHQQCPSSFYQDDYVASVLFHLGGIRFMSVWENYRKLVHHIDGVSTSEFQMHMDPKVFQREQETIRCLPMCISKLVDSSNVIHAEVDVNKNIQEF